MAKEFNSVEVLKAESPSQPGVGRSENLEPVNGVSGFCKLHIAGESVLWHLQSLFVLRMCHRGPGAPFKREQHASNDVLASLSLHRS